MKYKKHKIVSRKQKRMVLLFGVLVGFGSVQAEEFTNLRSVGIKYPSEVIRLLLGSCQCSEAPEFSLNSKQDSQSTGTPLCFTRRQYKVNY